MRMEQLKSQRHCFSGRTLLLLTVLIWFSMNVMGYDPGIDEYINEDLVKGVAYDYEMFERVPGKLDCKGILHISLSLPDEVSHIVLNCSSHYNPPNRLLWGKVLYPGDAADIETSNNIYWDTYFAVTCFHTDGSVENSPIYSISDYVDEQDLELLRQQASVEDMEAESVRMYVEGRALYVEPAGSIVLSVFDTCGRRIFSGDMEQPMSIPLGTLTSPVIIVNYITGDKPMTKKLVVK